MLCVGPHDVVMHEINYLSKLYRTKAVLWPNVKGTIGTRLVSCICIDCFKICILLLNFFCFLQFG